MGIDNNKYDSESIKDSLSEVTRRERRWLLGMSMLAITVALTGMMPSKIESFGITFNATQKTYLFMIIGLIIIYYFMAFCFYAYVDLSEWKKNHNAWCNNTIDKIALSSEELNFREEMRQDRLDHIKKISNDVDDITDTEYMNYIDEKKDTFESDFNEALQNITHGTRLRMLFDVYLPLFVAGISIFLLYLNYPQDDKLIDPKLKQHISSSQEQHLEHHLSGTPYHPSYGGQGRYGNGRSFDPRQRHY